MCLNFDFKLITTKFFYNIYNYLVNLLQQKFPTISIIIEYYFSPKQDIILKPPDNFSTIYNYLVLFFP